MSGVTDQGSGERCPSCGLSPYERGIGDSDISRIVAERNALLASNARQKEALEKIEELARRGKIKQESITVEESERAPGLIGSEAITSLIAIRNVARAALGDAVSADQGSGVGESVNDGERADDVVLACAIDTCGENREDGKPWPATIKVTRENEEIAVCSCHADGWYD